MAIWTDDDDVSASSNDVHIRTAIRCIDLLWTVSALLIATVALTLLWEGR